MASMLATMTIDQLLSYLESNTQFILHAKLSVSESLCYIIMFVVRLTVHLHSHYITMCVQQ